MQFHNIRQNSDEWLLLRSGKVTGSGASKIMANLGKAFGEPAKKYAAQIAIERITGNYSPSTYSNAHMERGHEQEPLARGEYEDMFFVDVDNGGFFGDDFMGCSPDGLVGENGVVEIKSVIATTHFATVKKQSFDSAYKWQLLFNLKTTGREWIDYVSYCSEFPQESRLFVHRLNADQYQDEFKAIDERVDKFINLVGECTNIIKTSEYSI